MYFLSTNLYSRTNTVVIDRTLVIIKSRRVALLLRNVYHTPWADSNLINSALLWSPLFGVCKVFIVSLLILTVACSQTVSVKFKIELTKHDWTLGDLKQRVTVCACDSMCLGAWASCHRYSIVHSSMLTLGFAVTLFCIPFLHVKPKMSSHLIVHSV